MQEPNADKDAEYASSRIPCLFFLTIATEFVPLLGARLGTPLLMSPLRLQQRKRRSLWRLAAALLAMMRLYMIRLLQIQVREHKFVVNGNLWARRVCCMHCTPPLPDCEHPPASLVVMRE
jgi:hypothetical protein